MENIIIILLGLAAAAYSAYRKNKNEQQKDSPPPKKTDDTNGEQAEGMERDSDFLEEYFETVNTGEQSQSHPYSHSRNDNRAGWYEDSTDDLKQERQSISDRAGALQQKQSTTTLDKNKKSTYEKKTGSTFEEAGKQYKKTRNAGQKIRQRGFNLRKAVIYSEILNRKYS